MPVRCFGRLTYSIERTNHVRHDLVLRGYLKYPLQFYDSYLCQLAQMKCLTYLGDFKYATAYQAGILLVNDVGNNFSWICAG